MLLSQAIGLPAERSHKGVRNWFQSLESDLISEEYIAEQEEREQILLSVFIQTLSWSDVPEVTWKACGRAKLQSHVILGRFFPSPVSSTASLCWGCLSASLAAEEKLWYLAIFF